MKRRYLRQQERYLKQKQKKYTSITEEIKYNNLKILDALRPVVFYNHNKYMPDSLRYSISGSGFTIKHGDTYLFLTARHTVCHKDSIHNTYESEIDIDIIIPSKIGFYDLKYDSSKMPIDMIYRVPINHEFQETFGDKSPITDAFFSKEAKDITIMSLSDEFNGNYVDWQHSLGHADTKDLGLLQEGDKLVAIGFPKKYNFTTPNEIDNTSSMTIYKCFVYGKCSKILNGAVEAIMETDYNCKGLKNLDGMSGSAVFKIEDDFALKCVGMTIQGDTENGKTLRFLTVNWISIYLMQTDISFPFSRLESDALDVVSQNYFKELKTTIGDRNVNVKEDTITITINETDTYSFKKHHHIYYMVITLLYGTDAYSSKYIYILTNIINYTKDRQKAYNILKSHKHIINREFIDFLDNYAHNIDNFQDSKIPLENIDTLIEDYQNRLIGSQKQ